MTDIRRVREEMQFLTNTITTDVDYLLYLLLKKPKEPEIVQQTPSVLDHGYLDSDALDDWFNKL